MSLIFFFYGIHITFRGTGFWALKMTTEEHKFFPTNSAFGLLFSWWIWVTGGGGFIMPCWLGPTSSSCLFLRACWWLLPLGRWFWWHLKLQQPCDRPTLNIQCLQSKAGKSESYEKPDLLETRKTLPLQEMNLKWDFKFWQAWIRGAIGMTGDLSYWSNPSPDQSLLFSDWWRFNMGRCYLFKIWMSNETLKFLEAFIRGMTGDLSYWSNQSPDQSLLFSLWSSNYNWEEGWLVW